MTNNQLSGITLAGHKIFYEYLLKGGKQNLTYDLDQFDHELRMYSFRKPDADILKFFLGSVKEVLKSDYFEVLLEDTKSERLLFKTSAQCCTIKVPLDFMNEPALVIRNPVEIVSHTVLRNPEEYRHSEVYRAWENVVGNLKLDQDLRFSRSVAPTLGYYDGRRYVRGDILEEILSNITHSFHVVQRAYHATNNLQREYNERISHISQRLLDN
jgi:hypothetical protein